MAICTLFSFVNPVHEQRLAELVAEEGFEGIAVHDIAKRAGIDGRGLGPQRHGVEEAKGWQHLGPYAKQYQYGNQEQDRLQQPPGLLVDGIEIDREVERGFEREIGDAAAPLTVKLGALAPSTASVKVRVPVMAPPSSTPVPAMLPPNVPASLAWVVRLSQAT